MQVRGKRTRIKNLRRAYNANKDDFEREKSPEHYCEHCSHWSAPSEGLAKLRDHSTDSDSTETDLSDSDSYEFEPSTTQV